MAEHGGDGEHLPLLVAAGWQGGESPTANRTVVIECPNCGGKGSPLLAAGKPAAGKAEARVEVSCAGNLRGESHPAGCPWGVTGALLLADMFGIGSLALPGIRNVHDVGGLSLVATGCMAAAVLICMLKLLALPGSAFEQTSLLPPREETGGFTTGLVALMNLCFAFGGQASVNWMRYLSAMNKRSEFKKAAELADACMTAAYVVLAVTAYWKLGNSFDTSLPITSIFSRSAWTVLMNVCLLARCLVAYILNINVFTDLVTRSLPPAALAAVERVTGEQAAPRACWACVSLVGLAFSFAVAWTTPFFSTVLAFIAVCGDVLAPYTLPALFALLLLDDLPRLERGLLKAIIPLSALFAAFGLVAAMMDLVARLSQRAIRGEMPGCRPACFGSIAGRLAARHALPAAAPLPGARSAARATGARGPARSGLRTSEPLVPWGEWRCDVQPTLQSHPRAEADVDVPLEEAWDLWENRELIPNWMPWITSVRVLAEDPRMSRWTLSWFQFGRQWEFSWLALNMTPMRHQKIHWRSVPGSVGGSLGSALEVANRGQIRFSRRSPGACTVRLTISYEVPGPMAPFANLLKPIVEGVLEKDMQRFAAFALEQTKQKPANTG
eukprot:scaffold21.g2094.t1